MDKVQVRRPILKVISDGCLLWIKSFPKLFIISFILVVCTTTFTYFFFSEPELTELNISFIKAETFWYLVPVYVYIPYLFVSAMFFVLHNMHTMSPDEKFSIVPTLKQCLTILFVMIVSSIVILFSFLIFFIPGIIFTVILQFYLPVTLLENRNWRTGFNHTCNLVWGQWWRTTITLLIPVLLFVMGMALLEHIAFYILALEKVENITSYHLLTHTLLLALFIPFAICIIYTHLQELKMRENDKETRFDRALAQLTSFW